MLSIPNAYDRYQGYLRALQEANLPMDPDLLALTDFSERGAYEATQRLLQLPNPPTAIFAANDVSAIGALRAAKDTGLHVPEDIAIIGYDGAPITELTEPPLSTVQQPAAEMGRTAARLLIDVIEGNTPVEQVVKLPAELLVRASSRAKH